MKGNDWGFFFFCFPYQSPHCYLFPPPFTTWKWNSAIVWGWLLAFFSLNAANDVFGGLLYLRSYGVTLHCGPDFILWNSYHTLTCLPKEGFKPNKSHCHSHFSDIIADIIILSAHSKTFIMANESLWCTVALSVQWVVVSGGLKSAPWNSRRNQPDSVCFLAYM